MIVNATHSGRTIGGRYAYRPLVQMEPDDFPPDSNYWAGRARYELGGLHDVMGEEWYQEWCDECIADTDTWKDIANKAAEALAKALEQEHAECIPM